MGTNSSERIVATCDCGARLRVPASAAGKRGKCPKCGGRFVVPTPEPAPAGDGWSTDGDDPLGELAAAEQAGAVGAGPASLAPPSAGVKPCPSCGTTLAADAVLCTSCGYNLKSGRKAKLKEARGAGIASVAGQAAEAAGGFVLGCIVCGVAALVGAGAWYGVVMATGYEIGWVAWAVGGLCGFGMALGSRSTGILQGVVAAGFALGAIVVAKVLIFNTVLGGVFSAAEHELQRGFVISNLAGGAIVADGHDPNSLSEEEYDEYWVDAERRVEAMSDDEVQAELDRIEDETGESFEGIGSSLRAESSFWLLMFSPFDLIFIGLAVLTALKVGSSGLDFSGGE